jgi:alkylated DNA repair dioxygenase AlkB
MTCHRLEDQYKIYIGSFPDVTLSDAEFELLWAERPQKAQEVMIHGKLKPIPRRQCAYEKPYRFSGITIQPEPVTPEVLKRLLVWSKRFDERLNGLLVNFYDATLHEYIGAHNDSTSDMAEGAPIVTISLGAERVFRIFTNEKKPFKDLPVGNGTVIVLPFDTNKHFKHGVPHFERFDGRRISVTVRAFVPRARG